jgi:hypothetical protein
MALPVCVPLHGFETTKSLISRLAAANGFCSAKMLMSMTGIRPSKLSQRNPNDIARLAQWSGADPATLASYIPVVVADGKWRVGGALLHKQTRRGKGFRYCPMCVVDDVDNGDGRPLARPYLRLTWTCRDVVACARHGCELVEPSFAQAFQNDFCRFVDVKMNMIREQARDIVPPSLTEVDAYIERRIQGAGGEPYLDGFDAYVVLDLCRHLGALLRDHRRVVTGVPEDVWESRPREIGFHIARQGEERIRGAFGEVARCKRDRSSGKIYFQSLGVWLRQNAHQEQFAPIVELFQDVAERNLPLGPGEVCFVPVRRRYRHTVHSAAVEYGLGRDRVIQLLNEAGLLKRRLVGRGCFSVDDAEGVLTQAPKALVISRGKLPERLGASKDLTEQILNANLLRRARAPTTSHDRPPIIMQDLTHFQRRVFANVTAGAVDETMPTLKSIKWVAGVDPLNAIIALIDGKLGGTRSQAGHGYSLERLRFDRREVFTYWNISHGAPRVGAGGVALTQTDAAKFLIVKPGTIPYLLRNDALDVWPGELENDRTRSSISMTSLERFADKYIGQIEAAEILHLRKGSIAWALEEMRGIKPVYVGSSVVSSIYLRDEVLRSRYVLRDNTACPGTEEF